MCEKCRAVYETEEKANECEQNHMPVKKVFPVYDEHAQVPHRLNVFLDGGRVYSFRNDGPINNEIPYWDPDDKEAEP